MSQYSMHSAEQGIPSSARLSAVAALSSRSCTPLVPCLGGFCLTSTMLVYREYTCAGVVVIIGVRCKGRAWQVRWQRSSGAVLHSDCTPMSRWAVAGRQRRACARAAREQPDWFPNPAWRQSAAPQHPPQQRPCRSHLDDMGVAQRRGDRQLQSAALQHTPVAHCRPRRLLLLRAAAAARRAVLLAASRKRLQRRQACGTSANMTSTWSSFHATPFTSFRLLTYNRRTGTRPQPRTCAFQPTTHHAPHRPAQTRPHP